MKKASKIIACILIIALLIVSYIFNLWYRSFNYILNLDNKPVSVSLINLIAHPRKYDGRLVQVEGVGSLKFECTALFLSKDNHVSKNAVWVDFYSEDENGRRDVIEPDVKDGDYVLVEGIFNPRENGHYDLYSGSLENITRYSKAFD